MAKKVSDGGSRVLQWLLEEDQPAIRYLAFTRLLDKPEHDPEVKEARKAIATRGWAAQIVNNQDPAGWWAREDSLYRPKYLSTNWMLLVLSDLGLTKEEPRIYKACELWISRFSKKDGGFGIDGSSRSHLCTTGNMARALVQFGYVDHPRVRHGRLVPEESEAGAHAVRPGESRRTEQDDHTHRAGRIAKVGCAGVATRRACRLARRPLSLIQGIITVCA